MSAITIHLLTIHDAEELLAFELENRAYWSQFVPDRGDDYYHLANMQATIDAFVQEQEQGLLYMHLIRTPEGRIAGRVNLYDITRGARPEAELGYRIGEAYGGKGYATEAVRLALEAAFTTYRLARVRAAALAGNLASQRVLLKNGFTETGRTPRAVEFRGEWHDFVHFIKEKQS